jgi:hypothetical protein
LGFSTSFPIRADVLTHLTKKEQTADISADADVSAIVKPQLVEKIEAGRCPDPREAAMRGKPASGFVRKT